MLRVLLITREPWRDDSNEGSVLSSWFNGQPMEFAQIYCKPGIPDSKCCKRFFQLTDKMAVKNLLRGEPMGAVVDLTAEANETKNTSEREKKSFYDFFRRHNWASFFLAQEFLWGLANWESKALEEFVDDFAPDVIFAPLCHSRYVMAIQRWASKRLNKPMAGIIWDDLYSFKQWHISPIYWLNRLLQRRSVKKTVDMCSRLYTLSPQQAEGFGELFHRSFDVLPKVGEMPESQPPAVDSGIRFIYAGGVYFGRLKTLALVKDALAKLNQAGYPCQLDIYSNSPDVESLEESGVCKVHTAVSAEELKSLYAHSHVALHVEGFSRSNEHHFQLSFSSKIVDCLSSGCAVLAVCPSRNCGFRYLQASQAAVCVDQLEQLPAQLEMLVKDHEQRNLWAERAKSCLCANHTKEHVSALIHKQLSELSCETVNE